jgi:hypothetical protein
MGGIDGFEGEVKMSGTWMRWKKLVTSSANAVDCLKGVCAR